MSDYVWGQAVVARYPYSDFSTFKLRPVIVVSGGEFLLRSRDVAVIAITSQVSDLSQAYQLDDWQLISLTRPSAFKPHIATLDRLYLRQSLGMLSSRDQQKLRNLLPLLLGFSA